MFKTDLHKPINRPNEES